VIAASLGYDKATVNWVVIRAKHQEDTPVRKEGSDSPKKIKILLLICLKRLIKKNPASTASKLKMSLTELSSVSELSL
jgi:hypothetical protein